MAEVDFDDFEGGYPAARVGGASRWVNLAGAACSIALVLGVVVWGYKLAVRDVAGIPVVRALEGPLRVAPDNPGGDIAMHQGLSVNAVAAVGSAMPLPEKVVLAPREVSLSDDDAAGLAVLASAATDLPKVAPQTDVALQSSAAIGAALKPVEVTAPPAPDLGADSSSDIAIAAPVPETQADAVAAALAAALADDGSQDTVAPLEGSTAVARSLRPMRRPTEAAQPMTETAAAAPPVAEVESATIAAGTRLVQLGAFDDEAGARDAWTNLQAQFPELFGTKAMVVQSAQSGGRTFYRLRAHGFENEDETRRFCAALLAENASCIAVAQR